MSIQTKCKVNPDGSVCLQNILNSFNSSIKEEHAWALCYQCARYYIDCFSTHTSNIYNVGNLSDVYLLVDGNVHENTVKSMGSSRKAVRSERDVIVGLGVIIYTALDQGSQSGEEILISHDLEQFISDMINDDPTGVPEHSIQETDDEGIERDSEEPAYPCITLQEVVTRCETHLGVLTKTQIEAHYKAVVRALVAEALELSTFLEKVAQGTLQIPTNYSKRSDLDWAKFWVQVIGELRMGVKLKKVNFSKAPIEYELTPYEILMKDIRSCRYNLRKIMVNGNVPSRVTKDAHAIILEFIRSRPPLKKVSDRKLPPASRKLTPREQLLNAIRKGPKLRPTPRASNSSREENKVPDETHEGRRIIKVDFTQFTQFEEDDDDDDDDDAEPGLWSSEDQPCNSRLDAYDLATEDCGLRSSNRRHTLEVSDPNLVCYSVPQSRPCSRQSCNSSEAESILFEPEVAKAIQEELTNCSSWQDTIALDDRLSLTLSEIVHIRSVLTKAELEALPIEGRVRYDVETRKVCFLCLKTRFGIFGPWGQRCTLCKRTVCSKCYCRMNIPMEHFSSVPVVLLSPSIMCTPEDESISKSLVNKIMDPDFVHSAGNSPDRSRPGSSMESSIISDPGTITKVRIRGNRTKTSLMTVCLDCKMMVLQIIKSARANRSASRNKTLQNLTLNLSPVFQ